MNPSEKLSILWLEDSENDFLIFSRKLRHAGLHFDSTNVESARDFVEAIETGSWDAIISDYNLPGFSPEQALVAIKERDLDIPLIILSGAVHAENAVELMRLGAKDFVLKDNIVRLVPALRRELGEKKIRDDRRSARRHLVERNMQLATTLEQLRESQANTLRLQRIRAVGEMATGVAHDFNNALMKISGLLSTVSSDVGTGQSLDDHEETFALLQTAVDESKAIMKRVAKFYANSADLDPDEVDLHSLCKDVMRAEQAQWANKDIKVIWDFGEIESILSKSADLQGGLQNVVRNAVDAMPDGGTITIATSPAPDDRVLLTISDTGEGMSEDVLRRCLEPFFSTKGEFGTGLGLGITDAVVQQYGGILSVDSQKGLGTIVSFVFKQTLHLEPSLPLKEGGALVEDLQILIAEDEVIVGKIMKKLIERRGHSVEVTHSGAEALEAFENSSFDLVISDRSMPNMTGDELALAIREQSPGTPFLMVTGFGDLMNARGEKPEGVDLVMPKPIDDEKLHEAINAVVMMMAR